MKSIRPERERWLQCQRRVELAKKYLPRRRDRLDPLFKLFRDWASAELTPIEDQHWEIDGEVLFSERATDIPRYRRALGLSLKDLTALAEYGFTVAELVMLASMGDKESLMRLIELDKEFLTSQLARDWIRRTASREDRPFFEELAKAVVQDTFRDKEPPRRAIAIYLLWFLGFRDLPHKSFLAFLEAERPLEWKWPSIAAFRMELFRLGLSKWRKPKV